MLDQINTPLTFRIVDGVYVIVPGHPAHRPETFEFTARNLPFDQAVNRLFHLTHAAYRLDIPESLRKKPITVTIKNAVMESALNKLLNVASNPTLSFAWDKQGVEYVIRSFPIPPVDDFKDIKIDISGGKISLNWKQVNAYRGLKALFNTPGAQYTLDPSLRGADITVSFKDLPFDKAVQKVAAACSIPIKVQKENDVYSFVLK
jgi:hypothetical protein